MKIKKKLIQFALRYHNSANSISFRSRKFWEIVMKLCWYVKKKRFMYILYIIYIYGHTQANTLSIRLLYIHISAHTDTELQEHRVKCTRTHKIVCMCMYPFYMDEKSRKKFQYKLNTLFFI